MTQIFPAPRKFIKTTPRPYFGVIAIAIDITKTKLNQWRPQNCFKHSKLINTKTNLKPSQLLKVSPWRRIIKTCKVLDTIWGVVDDLLFCNSEGTVNLVWILLSRNGIENMSIHGLEANFEFLRGLKIAQHVSLLIRHIHQTNY